MPQSDLPVLLPAAERLARGAAQERNYGSPALRLTPAHGVAILLLFLLATGAAEAESAPVHASVIFTLLKWSPLLLKGFAFNIAISFFAMAIGTAAGIGLGLAQISLLPPVRRTATFATHFFRNAPWLVLL
ncbi:MAG TPA: amino acid ABC transporter permease, partial [Thermoanaerobaculia bacterium]|nr:amino acid ABC transporter permease [Thermoanaerobaculia bacterium]